MIAKDKDKQLGRGGRRWRAVLVWFLAVVVLLPFAQMIWTAQRPREVVDRSYRYLSQLLPAHEMTRHLEIAPRPLRVALTNSIIVSGTCALLCVVLGAAAGYAFAKKEFRGKTALFDLVLASMAVPPAILMVPVFRLTVVLHIYDTLLALILPFSVTGFAIVYMRYAISAVPDSLIESARLDGLSEAAALFRVVLPSIWPSVLTLAVVQGIATWNLFVLPLAVTASQENYTVAILLGRLMSDFGGLMWNDIMVVVIAALLPIAVVFVVFNRWILKGSTAIGDEHPAGRRP